MNYTVDPGLYALGKPGPESPVFVSANYKLSFDRLREALPGRDGWILVLDTKGINVWCAAGKGTFGTTELVERIRRSGLEKVIHHRKLIVPQLGAPGIAAHRVQKLSGFQVIYGPIRAKDLTAFMDAGWKATREMRRQTFTLKERAVLIPIEFGHGLKWAVLAALLFSVLSGVGGARGFWTNVFNHGSLAALALLISLIMGTVFTILFLPYIPGRAFALKGFILGLGGYFLFLTFTGGFVAEWPVRLEKMAWAFMLSAYSAYLAMDFTGASIITSLSGVKKEMRWAVPLEIGGGTIGLVLWFIACMAL